MGLKGAADFCDTVIIVVAAVSVVIITYPTPSDVYTTVLKTHIIVSMKKQGIEMKNRDRLEILSLILQVANGGGNNATTTTTTTSGGDGP